MEKLIYTIYCMVVLSSICFSQKKINLYDLKEFKFNSLRYNNIAKDSIKSIYYKQQQLYQDHPNTSNIDNAISLKYKIEELNFYSIPIFKLNRKARKFNSKSNILSLIEFNDSLKEQRIYITNSNKEIINFVDLPNFNFKIASLFPDEWYLKNDIKDYEELVLKQFLDSPSAFPFKLIKQQFVERPKNFFFRILGFRYEIFEIDLTTGELFVNYFSSRREPRLEINDYLKKYIDKRVIRDIANNIFDKSYIKKKKGEIQEIKM